MMYHNRRYHVAEVATAEELAEKLTEQSWVLCQAFLLGDLLFLNDSTCEDGAAEFAVVRHEGNGRGEQIESITFSWITKGAALELILGLAHGAGCGMGEVEVKLERSGSHHCALCA